MGNYSITNLPVGMIIPVINSDNVPLGTLECNGALISKTTYANLWSGTNMSIGSQYGESGGFFRLPDFRGRMPRHISGATGRDPDAATRYADQPGAPTGNEVGSMQDDAFDSHRHGVSVLNNALTTPDGAHGSTGSEMTNIPNPQTDFTGGSETRSKNFNLKWCIKY